MRADIEEAEDNKVDVQKRNHPSVHDRAARWYSAECAQLESVEVYKATGPKHMGCNVTLKRGDHLRIIGPNGIGKTTLLEKLAGGNATGEHIADGVRVGYYHRFF